MLDLKLIYKENRLGDKIKRQFPKVSNIQGAPKNTLVHFLYYFAKSINAIGLKISAISIAI